MTMEITEQEKYEYFIEELKSILVEGVFNANLMLIQTYHTFGARILEETVDLTRKEIYGENITKRIANDVGKSQRTIQKCVQFARKYPDLEEFLSTVAEGKSISWNKIANKYIVEVKQLAEPERLLSFSVEQLERYLTSNTDFLVKTAEITREGIVFFLPKDRCD